MKAKLGDVFGRLTVIGFVAGSATQQRKVICRCECGVVKAIRHWHVTDGLTVSCGCVKRKHQMSVGDVVGRLTVIAPELHRVGRKLKMLCRCECGTEKLVGVPELATGDTKSCGCLVVEQVSALALKHGDEGSPLYSVWHTMKARCANTAATNYKNYGARGIRVAAVWRDDFATFRDWSQANGYAPGLEIDRVDVNGNYEPGNCRWATKVVNANNRRNNVRLTAFGETKTMRDWSRDERCSVGYSTLKQRILKGKWADDIQGAISLPPLH